jgi:Transposase DDE domain
VSSCPLSYRGGNAPDKPDVQVILMLAMLAGHRRCAQVTALRGDAVPVQALGRRRTVSEDALRRAMERIDEAASTTWMRPSRVPHTFLVGNLHLLLDIQVSTGKQRNCGRAETALGRLLDELQGSQGDRRAALVRGDSGYGNEGILLELELRDQPYLLRLRQTANVKRLVAMAFGRTDWSRADAQGRQMIKGQVRLRGSSQPRRVVIVRQRMRDGIARERRLDNGRQLQLYLGPAVFRAGDKPWEYEVLVTDLDCPIESVAQMYRERANAENAFDKLQKQCGLSGFTTQDTKRCQTMARACASVYNWWSWYGRAAHAHARTEAITSRLLLLAAVGKAVNHANQTTPYLTPLHGKATVPKRC